jgi:hypothetical protein
METLIESPDQPTKKDKQKATSKKIKTLMKSSTALGKLPSVSPRRFNVKTRNRRKNRRA